MYCYWEDCKSGTTTLEKRWAVSYKTKHALNVLLKNFTPRNLSQRNENVGSHKNL